MYFRIYFLFIIIFSSCKGKEEKKYLLKEIDAARSGIDFVNKCIPDFNSNILDYNYFYNGGGVAAADFNNDGLTDLFFTGNQSSSKMYLNKGDMVFEDITAIAKVSTNVWATGVAVADINDDGLLDMYVSVAGIGAPDNRRNLLFINEGINGDGYPTFKEMATEYGCADTSYTSQAVFLDFDMDGDLDLYLANHYQDLSNPNYPKPLVKNKVFPSRDILYRNDGNKFTDISYEAGIWEEGYSLGIAVSDFNKDGWPDLYVSRDFVYDDAIYLNNKNGTFYNATKELFDHTSQFSMGCDVADYNNDGWSDIISMDMLPKDNFRQKMMNIAMNNDRFNQILQLGYMPQYSRNMLHLNNGKDEHGNIDFSEIGQLAGVYSTDWSWSALWMDVDNDSRKDLMVTNGIPRDITNNDFITYRSQSIEDRLDDDFEKLKKEFLGAIELLQPVNIPNMAFRNNGDFTFSNASEQWGLNKPVISNGAVLADLDNDGDLDYITNNMNATASIYTNQTNTADSIRKNFLRIKMPVSADAVGAKVYLYANGGFQYVENYFVRGFQSSQEPIVHFGLGTISFVDSLVIEWPFAGRLVYKNIPVNTTYLPLPQNGQSLATLEIRENHEKQFIDITNEIALKMVHKQPIFEDFDREPLLPHRFSKNGPFLAVGDVNGDGLDDVWMSGAAMVPGKLGIQKANGSFEYRNMPDSGYEDMQGVFFDADNDGDIDLYIVSGGNAYNAFTAPYEDRLYINNGKGDFVRNELALPQIYSSGSVVTMCDFDKDGDIDLFIGGRVVPNRYSMVPESYLLVNNGNGIFTNNTKAIAPGLEGVGMVTCATWADLDSDGWADLIVAGEWMTPVIWKNEQGNFKNITPKSLSDVSGMWFSIQAADIDNDNDVDIVIGNLGLNNRFKIKSNRPLSLNSYNLVGNQAMLPIMSYWLNDQEVPFASRDEISFMAPQLKKKFDDYSKYGKAQLSEVVDNSFMEPLSRLEVKQAATVWLENKGNMQFELHELPIAAQFSVVQSIKIQDFDNDGHQDLLVSGNFYNPVYTIGRYDAGRGVLLKGDSKGNWKDFRGINAGTNLRGDVRTVTKMKILGQIVFLVGVNNAPLKFFKLNQTD